MVEAIEYVLNSEKETWKKNLWIMLLEVFKLTVFLYALAKSAYSPLNDTLIISACVLYVMYTFILQL